MLANGAAAEAAPRLLTIVVSAGVNAFYTQLAFGLVIVISVVLQTIIDRRVRRQSITGR